MPSREKTLHWKFIEQFGPTTDDTVINADSFGLKIINRPRTAKPPTDALKRSIARTLSVLIYYTKSWFSRDMVHIMFVMSFYQVVLHEILNTIYYNITM